MKSFLISISFLVLFVILVAINCFFVTRILGDINSDLDSLQEVKQGDVPDTTIYKAERILEKWNKYRTYLSISINLAEIRDCTVSISNLAKLSKSDTFADFNAALFDARNRIGTLLGRERFSFANVF